MVDVFAHGMLSMAYLGRLLTDWVSPQGLREFTVRFIGIVELGNRLTCSGEVTKVTETGGEWIARIDIQAKNEFGDIKAVGHALIEMDKR